MNNRFQLRTLDGTEEINKYESEEEYKPDIENALRSNLRGRPLQEAGGTSGILPDNIKLWPLVLQRAFNHSVDIYDSVRYNHYGGYDSDHHCGRGEVAFLESKRDPTTMYLLVRNNFLSA